MPSRASILTGRYSSSTGVRTNGVVARDGQPLLPEILRDTGYDTAAFGKIHYHPTRKPAAGYWPENAEVIDSGTDLTSPYLGFDTIALACSHGDIVRGLHEQHVRASRPDLIERRGIKGALKVPDPGFFDAPGIETYKPSLPVELYPTTWVTDRTIEHLSVAKEPFFLWCGINDPHHPFIPPGEYWERFLPGDMEVPSQESGPPPNLPPHIYGYYEGAYRDYDTDGFLLGTKSFLNEDRLRMITAAYYGMVALIDDSVARIIRALNERGVANNTIIVFLSDHGELLGDHGLILKGPLHYQSLLRVPLIVHTPERVARRVHSPVSLVDVFPTILELAGVEPPEGTQGRPLVSRRRHNTPLLAGDAEGEILVEDDADALGLRLRTLITERYRLTMYAGESYGELYDLRDDPGERVNLWNDNRRLRDELRLTLLDRIVENQDKLPPKTSHA